MGIDLRSYPLLYHKVREIIDLMKGQHQNDEERLREIVTNAIILILTLFFDRKHDDFDDGNDEIRLTQRNREKIKSVLADVIDQVAPVSD